MVQRFKFLFFLLVLQTAGLTVLQGATQTTEQSAEAIDAVAARMKSLTQSLGGLPQPPSFDQKIQLPDALIPVKPAAKDKEIKKENET